MDDVEKALDLEQRKFSVLSMRIKNDEVREAKQIVADRAGQGLTSSEEISKRIVQLRMDKFEQRLAGRIGLRRDLAHLFPKLASPSEIQRLQKSIDQMIANFVAGESQERSVGPAGVMAARRAQYFGESLKQQAKSELEALALEMALTVSKGAGRPARKPAKRNPKYTEIDRALQQVAAGRPKSHEEVFRQLEGRRVRAPDAKPFRGHGWLAGFKSDRRAARVWLSRAWSRLSLPPFRRGPK